MQLLRAALIVAAVLVLTANDSRADWWPFGKSKEPEPASSRPGDGWWKLKAPRIGRSPSKPVEERHEPGMVERGFHKTTHAIGKTASVLNPLRYLPRKKSDPLPVTGRNLHEHKPKRSGFGSWFSSKPEPASPSTTSEWMRQGRPDFD